MSVFVFKAASGTFGLIKTQSLSVLRKIMTFVENQWDRREQVAKRLQQAIAATVRRSKREGMNAVRAMQSHIGSRAAKKSNHCHVHAHQGATARTEKNPSDSALFPLLSRKRQKMLSADDSAEEKESARGELGTPQARKHFARYVLRAAYEKRNNQRKRLCKHERKKSG